MFQNGKAFYCAIHIDLKAKPESQGNYTKLFIL